MRNGLLGLAASFMLSVSALAADRQLSLPPASTLPGLEEMSRAGPIADNPEWNADEIGIEIDTYLAEDKGFSIVPLFIRQDPQAADYVLVRDRLLAGILPSLGETNPIGLSFSDVDVTGDGLAEMIVQITCPSTCSDGDGCRTLVFSFDDEKAWRILLDVRTQEVGIKPGWDGQPSRIATISEKDGVRLWRLQEGSFASYENVRRSRAEIRAASERPAPIPPPPGP